MYEKKSVKSEQSKSFSKRNDSANKHTSNKSKETSSCNSCGVCSRLRSPQLSSEGISSALSYAKAVGKESCALSFMQSNYGNRFTASVLSPTIQKKCSCVGSCTECKGEEEAEKVAMSIMKMGSPALSKKASIDYKLSADGNEQGLISEIISNKGSGQKLDNNTHSFMEQRLGYDFSHVRVHTDSYAARKSNELNAEAFTIGRNIFFNAGRYNPASTEGKRLLAHELTHVVQQNYQSYIQRLGSNPGCSAAERTTIHQAIFNARGWLNKAIPKLEASPLSAQVLSSLRRNFGATHGVAANAPLIVGRVRTAYHETSTNPFSCATNGTCTAHGGGGHSVPGSHVTTICRNVTFTPGRAWQYQAGVVLHESFHAAFSRFTPDFYSGWHGFSGATAGYPGTGTDPLLNADSYTTLVMDLS